VARANATVVLLGESGTGKGQSARALHRMSGRRGPFIAVNCAAIPEALAESMLFGHKMGAFTGATRDEPGWFRAAHRGTLFIDEIGDMPAALQPKLLHAIEDGAVTPVGSTRPEAINVRIVAATSADLQEAVSEKRFRGDLYARLAEIVVGVPSLRERCEDVLPLLGHFLGEDAPPVSADLAERLLGYRWPFNIRELKNVATELKIRGAGQDLLTHDHISWRFDEPVEPASTGKATVELSRELVSEALAARRRRGVCRGPRTGMLPSPSVPSDGALRPRRGRLPVALDLGAC
jgi:DNA-binding NtrC family response regulator